MPFERRFGPFFVTSEKHVHSPGGSARLKLIPMLCGIADP
jgi:hypothetical protein